MSLERMLAQADIVSIAVGTTQNVDDIDEIGLQLLAPVAWGTVTVGFQVSNDGINWESVAAISSAATARTTGVVSTAAVGAFSIDVCNWLFFRINVTARTSGTVRAIMVGARRNTN